MHSSICSTVWGYVRWTWAGVYLTDGTACTCRSTMVRVCIWVGTSICCVDMCVSAGVAHNVHVAAGTKFTSGSSTGDRLCMCTCRSTLIRVCLWVGTSICMDMCVSAGVSPGVCNSGLLGL